MKRAPAALLLALMAGCASPPPRVIPPEETVAHVDAVTVDEVRAAGALYLHFVGPCFAFFGLSLALYFSSQGAGRILGPLLAGTARLAVVAIGGVILVKTQAPSWALFALVALGMVTMGVMTAGFVALTPWGPRPVRP